MKSKLAKLKGSVMELMSLSVFDVEWGEVVVLVVGIVALGGMRLAAVVWKGVFMAKFLLHIYYLFNLRGFDDTVQTRR